MSPPLDANVPAQQFSQLTPPKYEPGEQAWQVVLPGVEVAPLEHDSQLDEW